MFPEKKLRQQLQDPLRRLLSREVPESPVIPMCSHLRSLSLSKTLLTPDGKGEVYYLTQRDRRPLSADISIRQYRRVVMAHLLLRLRDLRGKLPLRGDRKDQLLLQRKEEENYIDWIIMRRKLVRTK